MLLRPAEFDTWQSISAYPLCFPEKRPILGDRVCVMGLEGEGKTLTNQNRGSPSEWSVGLVLRQDPETPLQVPVKLSGC